MKIYKYIVPAVSAVVFSAICMCGVSAEETETSEAPVTETTVSVTDISETTITELSETLLTDITESAVTEVQTTVTPTEPPMSETAPKPENGWYIDDNEKTYYYENGVAVTGLREIEGEKYLFSQNGAMKKGWYTVDGKRMFFDLITGKNLTGWIEYMNGRFYADSETGKYTGKKVVDGVTYMFSDKGILYNGWFEIDGSKYYSDMKNGLYTGEKVVNGITYKFSSGGIFQSGWQNIGGIKVFYDYDKAMPVYGWIHYNGLVYYSDIDNGKYTGEYRIDKSLYRFSEKGVLETGFQKFDDGIRYYYKDGKIAEGFSEIDGKTYYFGEDNLMQTGFVVIDKHTYYFDENGVMQRGWHTSGENKYYFGDDGKMSVGIAEIEGKKYYFDDKGIMRTGLIDMNGSRYYFAADGAMQFGWQVIDNKKYYFGKDGAMASGLVDIDGDIFNFGKDGAILDVLLGTPYLSQVGYPTGCESASAVMLLNDAGYNTTIDYFIDNALDIDWITVEGGTWYGPDPNVAFIGDPRSEYGYGCYAPVITKAINRILTGGDTAENITGCTLSQLLTDYIDNGTPVAVWATINMMEMRYTSDWIIRDTGEEFTWKGNEHCLVLVGYDKDYYYMNDPYNSNGLCKYERALVESRYAVMGYQAVVIKKGKE